MNQIIELTKSLIQFQSVHSRPEEIKNCAAFIEIYVMPDFFPCMGLMELSGVPTVIEVITRKKDGWTLKVSNPFIKNRILL